MMLSRLHTEQHRVKHAECTASPEGTATNLPRESLMLEDDVIEQRCPDLVVPKQRVDTADASMAA